METNNNNASNPALDQDAGVRHDEPVALPMMGFWESVRTCFRKYFDFKGRARRSEYWWYFLFSVVAILSWALLGTLLAGLPLGMAVKHISGNENTGFAAMVVVLAIPILFLILPSFSVQVRRLHDTGRSGWWLTASIILEVIASALPFILFGRAAADFGLFEEYRRSFQLSTTTGVAMVTLGIASEGLSIILIIFSAIDGHKTENQYGPSPKYQ